MFVTGSRIMGERILRPGIRTSEKTAALVRDYGWMAQVFFDWLLTLVDDYGRYDARPAVLRAELFPFLLELVREADASRCLEGLQAAGLIRLYAVDGNPYLEVLNFKQRMRANKSKWPSPADAGHCPDNATTMPTDTETDTETNKGRSRSRHPPPPDLPKDLDVPSVRKAWLDFVEHRREKGKPVTPKSAAACFSLIRKIGPERALVAIEHSIAGGYQGIFEPSSNGKRPVQHSGSRWADKPYCPG
jgi:hypothetical protein